MISSVKWASVPCFDVDNKEISEAQLADQILHQGLFAELKVTQGPIWIVPSTGDKESYATVKLDFEDNRAGSNLKILLNKNIFLNGKVCRMLPWVHQNSTPQCSQCLRWGHSRISCQTNVSYCATCSGQHMTSDHHNSCARGDMHKYELACINCLVAGMNHAHKATDRLCPFYLERNNKKNISALLATIRERRLEGYENPFGLTKVRRSSQTPSLQNNNGSTYNPRTHIAHTGNLPTQFLAEAAVITPDNSNPSLRLASSGDSLFRHIPNIMASQAEATTITAIQDTSIPL